MGGPPLLLAATIDPHHLGAGGPTRSQNFELINSVPQLSLPSRPLDIQVKTRTIDSSAAVSGGLHKLFMSVCRHDGVRFAYSAGLSIRRDTSECAAVCLEMKSANEVGRRMALDQAQWTSVADLRLLDGCAIVEMLLRLLIRRHL